MEFQVWDDSNYWCYFLPSSTTPTTATIKLSDLNSQCWDNSGTSFVSGTAIKSVQLVVPCDAVSPTPFDYCFLGLTID